MYVLDNLIAPPPLSAAISIVLICGLDWTGKALLMRTGLMNISERTTLRWQSVVVGSAILSMVLHPLALLNLSSRTVLMAIAAALLLAGAANLLNGLRHAPKCSSIRNWFRSAPISRSAIVVIMTGLGLTALGPTTNADALDYHIGVAIAVLNTGGFPNNPEWFHSRLAGNGEILNALGLAVGAEQFGAVLQFACLGAMATLMWSTVRVHVTRATQHSELVVLAAISSPVLLFLASTPKPQLWPVAMTTVAFALLAHPSIDTVCKGGLRARYALVCLLCMTAAQAKFNYILGGGIVGGLGLFTMLRRREMPAAILIGALAALTIMLPPALWKAHTYGTSLLDAMINPLPGHLPGTDRMIALASNNPDVNSTFPFPLSILIPDAPGAVTTVLGLGWILLFWLRPQPHARSRVTFVAIALSTAITVVAAPPSARMYLEPYFWGLYLCSRRVEEGEIHFPAPVRWIVTLQAGAFSLGCWIGAITLFPGALTPQWRESIMAWAANGYRLMQWIDGELPADAVLLNGHRSMALAPRKALSFGWTDYVDASSPEAVIYLEELKTKHVTHILLPDRPPQELPLSGCFGRVVAGPGPGRVVARNPFNTGVPYDAWVMEFHAEALPQCARDPAPNSTKPLETDPAHP